MDERMEVKTSQPLVRQARQDMRAVTADMEEGTSLSPGTYHTTIFRRRTIRGRAVVAHR